MPELQKENIRHIMTPISRTSPTVVQQGQTPIEAYDIIKNNLIHHIPILNGDKLVEIVSSNDFLKVMFNNLNIYQGLANLNNDFETIMKMVDELKRRGLKQNIMTVIADTDSVHGAAEKLMNGNFHSLPVINESNEIVGIVTSTDLIDYLHKHSR